MWITQRVEVPQAAVLARRFAEKCGFAKRAQWEIAIIASELASNLCKHAGSGLLSMHFLSFYEGSPAMVLATQDRGVFIGDPEQALIDGYSQGRYRAEGNAGHEAMTKPTSLGGGLGAIKRPSDKLHICSTQHSGTTVKSVKYLK